MPTKTYKMPEKIANLSADKFADIAEHPGKYDLTLFEFTEFLKYVTSIGATATNNVDKGTLDILRAENAELKLKNEELKKNLDHYKYKYERVMEMIDDITDEMVWDEEED